MNSLYKIMKTKILIVIIIIIVIVEFMETLY